MKLLFITQKIDTLDDDLAFTALWIKEFIAQGYEVEVICLEKGTFDESFVVHSLGKEQGLGRISRLLRFYRLIFSLRYDRVFIHMNPEYGTLGGWWWWLTKKSVYLWYTHYSIHTHLRITAFFATRMFAATKQSLPQYDGSPKKVVTGHGIDIAHWLREEKKNSDVPLDPFALVSVHRICRSKRIEISILALLHLPKAYTLTVYGRDVEKEYYEELQKLVAENNLTDHVRFAGPVPMDELLTIYPKYSLMLNMASETIDKTMLEAMLFGLYPVVSQANAKAIGLSKAPKYDTPEEVAAFISRKEWKQYNKAFLQSIVKEQHSLKSLIKKMSAYIHEGK